MGCYSDPTAAKALGGINREFSCLEKKANKLCQLLDEGKISLDDLEAAQSQFTDGDQNMLPRNFSMNYIMAYFHIVIPPLFRIFQLNNLLCSVLF